MIPSDLPLPHSSSNIKMSQLEKDELAEQWYAMMIKKDMDSQQDVNSAMSTLTRSISAASSKESLQEQRDPNNRNHQRRGPDGDRMSDKNTQHRDHADEYQYKRGFSKNSIQTKNNSKTDFLDGIIESLSELSKGDKNSESNILQEKKNGWSIHDSQRRMQERRSQFQLKEQNANVGVSYNYQQQQNTVGHENHRRSSIDPYGSQSLSYVHRSREIEVPVVRRHRSSSRQNGDRMFDESDDSQYSSSKYKSYSSGNSRANSRFEAYSSGGSKSQRSAKSMPASGDSSTYSFRKARSWNIDKSLRSNQNSLFIPISPESSQTPEEPGMILPLESTSSLSSGKYSSQSEPDGNRKPTSREQRTPSLVSSSSKDAGKILQHFVIPPSCGSVNPGAVDGRGTFNSLVEFFDDPIRNLSSRSLSKSTGESYPCRPRSRESVSTSRQSYKPFPSDNEGKFPKTKSQRRLEQEILRGMHKGSDRSEMEREPPISRERRRRSRENVTRMQQERKEDKPSDDFEAIWGESDERQPPVETANVANHEPRFSSGGTKIVPSQFGTRFGVLSQLTSCNATGQESPPKVRDAVSSSPRIMFEKIQRQLTSQPIIDSSGFPMKVFDGSSSEEQEQRIKEKLDAVRAKSLRNFQRMESGSKQNETSKNEQERDLSTDTFRNGDSSKTSKDENSVKNNIQGKRLDKSFDDINTDLLDDPAMRSNANKNSTTERIPSSSGSKTKIDTSPRVVANEISLYMYVAYSQFGDDALKVLKLCGHHTMPTPDRRKGEILVRIQASTISETDCTIRRGEWKNMSMDPFIIPGVALVGKAMGREKKKPRPSSSNIEPGDNVLALVRSGANARYICIQKHLLIKVPPKLHPDRVVCLAETYLTAFQALHLGQRGGIRYRENSLRGKSILIMNAYSPVGKAIIELARLGGASMCYGLINDDLNDTEGTGYSSSDIHHQYNTVEEWGAIPLSTDPQEWLTLIGRQIDILVTSHNPNHTGRVTADHWKALNKEGQVHAVCAHPGLSELEQRNLILGSQPSKKPIDTKAFRLPSCRPGGREKMADRAIFYNIFDSWEGDRHIRIMGRKDLEYLVKILEADLIHPEIVDRVPLSKVAKAQLSLELNKVSGGGHLICSPWMTDKPKEQKRSRSTRQSQETTKYTV